MKRNTQILIRLSVAEKKGFEIATELAGIGLSTWARERLRTAAIQELQQAGYTIPFLKAIPLTKTEDGK